jgi:putative transposase
MVRAGVVTHPVVWAHSGYREIQQPRERYAVIDLKDLTELCGFAEVGDFQTAHREWVEQALASKAGVRDDRWSEAIAVGSLAFADKVKGELGVKAMYRDAIEAEGSYALDEPSEGYAGKFTAKNDALRLGNTVLWDESVDDART